MPTRPRKETQSKRKRISKKDLERQRGEKLSKREAMSLLGGPMMPKFVPPPEV